MVMDVILPGRFVREGNPMLILKVISFWQFVAHFLLGTDNEANKSMSKTGGLMERVTLFDMEPAHFAVVKNLGFDAQEVSPYVPLDEGLALWDFAESLGLNGIGAVLVALEGELEGE